MLWNIKIKNLIETENYYIFISEWLEGCQPTKTDRHLIKDFFKKLAHLNLNNISPNSFSSMYLDGKSYPSIERALFSSLAKTKNRLFRKR